MQLRHCLDTGTLGSEQPFVSAPSSRLVLFDAVPKMSAEDVGALARTKRSRAYANSRTLFDFFMAHHDSTHGV